MVKLDSDFWWDYMLKMIKDSDMGKKYIEQKSKGEQMEKIDEAIAQGCMMGMTMVSFNYVSAELYKDEIRNKTSWYNV